MSIKNDPDHLGLEGIKINNIGFKVNNPNLDLSDDPYLIAIDAQYLNNGLDHNAGDFVTNNTEASENAKHTQLMSIKAFNRILQANHANPIDPQNITQFCDRFQQEVPEGHLSSIKVDPSEFNNGHSLVFDAPLVRADGAGLHQSTADEIKRPDIVDLHHIKPINRDNAKSYIAENGHDLSDEAQFNFDERKLDTEFNSNYGSRKPMVEGYIENAQAELTPDGLDYRIKLDARTRRDLNPFSPNAGTDLNSKNQADNYISLNQFNKLLILNHKSTITRDDVINSAHHGKSLLTSQDNIAFAAPTDKDHETVDFNRLSSSKHPFNFNEVEKPLNHAVRTMSAAEESIRKHEPDVYAKMQKDPSYVGSMYHSNLYNRVPKSYAQSESFKKSLGNIASLVGDNLATGLSKAVSASQKMHLKHKQRQARRRLWYRNFRNDPARATGQLIGHCIGTSLMKMAKGCKWMGKVAENHVNRKAIDADFKHLDDKGYPQADFRMARYYDLASRAIKANDPKGVEQAEKFFVAAGLKDAMGQPNVDPHDRFRTLSLHFANRADLTGSPQDVAMANQFLARKDQVVYNQERQSDEPMQMTREQMRAHNGFYEAYRNLNPFANGKHANGKSIDEQKAQEQKDFNDGMDEFVKSAIDKTESNMKTRNKSMQEAEKQTEANEPQSLSPEEIKAKTKAFLNRVFHPDAEAQSASSDTPVQQSNGSMVNSNTSMNSFVEKTQSSLASSNHSSSDMSTFVSVSTSVSPSSDSRASSSESFDLRLKVNADGRRNVNDIESSNASQSFINLAADPNSIKANQSVENRPVQSNNASSTSSSSYDIYSTHSIENLGPTNQTEDEAVNILAELNADVKSNAAQNRQSNVTTLASYKKDHNLDMTEKESHFANSIDNKIKSFKQQNHNSTLKPKGPQGPDK